MKLRILVIVLLSCLFLAVEAQAKIRDVESVEADGVKYAAHANEVTATEIGSTKLIWKLTLPVAWKEETQSGQEADVQWNVITEMRLNDSGGLLVEFKHGEKFLVDRKSSKWRHVP